MPDNETPEYPRFETGDAELDLLMTLAHAAAYAVAKDEELRVPTLLLTRPGGAIESYSIMAFEAPAHIAAKVLVTSSRATHAAIAFEGWCYEAEARPEDMANLKRGILPPDRVRPRDHPERFDVLNVIGEINGQPQHWRAWRIRPDPSGTGRLFEPWGWDHGINAPSNFNPLFVGPDEVRQAVRRYAELARLRDVARAGRN